MASDLLTIALSGTRAARGALDVTAQNIANAATEGYVRRTLGMAEVSAAGGQLRNQDISLSGVRIAGIDRNADMFRQAEVRRTTSDAARSNAELAGLENIESAIEQARPYDMIVEFEAALRRLSANPVDPSLRAATVAAAGSMAGGFNIASTSLDSAVQGLHFESSAMADQANLFAGELTRINLKVTRAGAGSSDRATLLDQRDNLLERLSRLTDISTQFAVDGSVAVRLGGSGGEVFVQGGTAAPLAMTTAPDGTVGFTVGGAPVALSGGALGGKAMALDAAAQARTQLDALAAGIMATVNAAQANGTALNGAGGPPLFAGTGAGGMALGFTDGTLLATAPAGSPAGSAHPDNLDALRAAFEGNGHAANANGLLFGVSSSVASRKVTSEALGAIASSARIALDQQSGVDLDQEAANLVRFQQAFQASGRAMQVATEIFDTLLGIGR